MDDIDRAVAASDKLVKNIGQVAAPVVRDAARGDGTLDARRSLSKHRRWKELWADVEAWEPLACRVIEAVEMKAWALSDKPPYRKLDIRLRRKRTLKPSEVHAVGPFAWKSAVPVTELEGCIVAYAVGAWARRGRKLSAQPATTLTIALARKIHPMFALLKSLALEDGVSDGAGFLYWLEHHWNRARADKWLDDNPAEIKKAHLFLFALAERFTCTLGVQVSAGRGSRKF